MKSREKMLAFMRKLVQTNKFKDGIIAAATQQIRELEAAKKPVTTTYKPSPSNYPDLAGVKLRIHELDRYGGRRDMFALNIHFDPYIICDALAYEVGPFNASYTVRRMCMEAAERMERIVMEHMQQLSRGPS